MFLHTFHPSPVLINLGFINIYWYGFLITVALVIGFFIAKHLFKRYQLAISHVYDLGFYLILFGLIGARLLHVFLEPDYYFKHPLHILKIWNGGLAIHGAVIAGIIILYLYTRKHKELTKNKLLILDIFAPLVVLGQSLGRWGNYFNQELYGLPSKSSWSIPISYIHRLPGYENFSYFQPIFLYESLVCFFIFILLLILHKIRLNHLVARSSSPVFPGLIFILYISLYSLQRFFIGFLRTDLQISFCQLRFDQWLSLIFIFFSIIFYLFLLKRIKKNI